MIKVRIVDIDNEEEVLTMIPKIPERQDQICCFFNGKFSICIIQCIRYYFLYDGNFDEVEIHVSII